MAYSMPLQKVIQPFRGGVAIRLVEIIFDEASGAMDRCARRDNTVTSCPGWQLFSGGRPCLRRP